MRILLAVPEASTRVSKRKTKCQFFTGCQWLFKLENMHAQFPLVAGFRPRAIWRKHDLIQTIVVGNHHLIDSDSVGVFEDKLALGDVLALFRH